jgi:hypothetical protein
MRLTRDIINSDFTLQIDNLETPEGGQTRTLVIAYVPRTLGIIGTVHELSLTFVISELRTMKKNVIQKRLDL